MGQLRNGDGVVINEITVSHRAVSNSPHDGVTFDPGNGIRGVNIGGRVWTASEDTVIRTVNVSFDGVSVECNTDFLMMLSDLTFRAEFVAKVKASHEEENRPHLWQPRRDLDRDVVGVTTSPASEPHVRTWQCQKCEQFTSVDMSKAGADEVAAQIDAGQGPLGCPGAPPPHVEPQGSTGLGEDEPTPTVVSPALEQALTNMTVDVKNAAKKAKRKGRR